MRLSLATWTLFSLTTLSWATTPALAASGSGVAMHGEPKYKPGFSHFEYANPKAPKGGEIVVGWEGEFDSLNPFTLKGIAPLLLHSLVFQSLSEHSYDEPFSEYPALASKFDIAADKMSMTIEIDPRAKFSDGKPVTADDVVFSFELLRSDKVPPRWSYYYADIKEAKKVGSHKVQLTFAKYNAELPLIALQAYILPKHVYGKGDFAKDFNTKAVGSGPYVVEEVKLGQSITYKRNPDFWGKDLNVFKGRYNFDRITVKYYKDATAMQEAFKKGDFDFFSVYSSKVWALDMTGDRFDKKWIKKELWPNQNGQGSQGFVFNMRRPIFQDIRVRQAIALAFDFDWSNQNLFYGQYKQNESYFENSPLKATGMPTKEELAVLEKYKGKIPEEVFAKPMGWLGKGMDSRQRLRTAMQLLKEAGYEVKDGVATGPGGKLEIQFLLRGQGFERIVEPFAKNLARLGIKVNLEVKEPSVWTKRVENREYDMIVASIGQSQSPGNEQRDYWTTKAADDPHSRNYSGLKSAAVDEVVEKLIEAKTREDLVFYTKILDRLLYHYHFQVHNWHIAEHRVAYWDKFGRPERFPLFYDPLSEIEFMWHDGEKTKKLEAAMKKGAPLL